MLFNAGSGRSRPRRRGWANFSRWLISHKEQKPPACLSPGLPYDEADTLEVASKAAKTGKADSLCLIAT